MSERERKSDGETKRDRDSMRENGREGRVRMREKDREEREGRTNL